MTVLIDTNVILDAIIGRSPYNVAAEKIFLLAAEEKINTCITANCVTDIYYLVHKHLHDISQSKEVLRKLFTIFTVLDITENDCEKSLELDMFDYEDALLSVCAKRNNMDYIIIRNIKDFSVSPLKAINPNDFLLKI